MTDLLPSHVRYFVITVTVDGRPVQLDDDAFCTALEAESALEDVLDKMLASGMQAKNLNLLAEGGWIGSFCHYGGSEPSVWHATYRELSTE